MFIMQNNESRLIKAAKRTIWAEATLVIIIIVISSWSVYALYKFTTGSDSFFGLTFTRPTRQDSRISSAATNLTEINTSQLLNSNHLSKQNNNNLNQDQFQPLNYSLQDDVKQKSQQLLQQLIAGQRELYANLDSFRSPLINPLEQIRRIPLVGTTNRFGDEGFRLMPNYRQLPLQQQQLARLRATDRSSDDTREDEPQTSRGLSRLEFADHSIDRIATEDENNIRGEDDKETPEGGIRESDESVTSTAAQDNNRVQPDEDSSLSPAEGENELPSGNEEGSDQEAPTNDSAQEEDVPQTSHSEGDSSSESDQSSSNSNDEQTASTGSADNENSASKETSQSIDDEVERMTQPSSGVVHQQERPFDYKNTVQFDDSISNGFGTQSQVTKAVPPGDQVARFEIPQGEIKSAIDRLNDRAKDSDLQVDHNSLVVQSGANETTRDHISDASKDRKPIMKRRKKVITGREEKLISRGGNDTKAIKHNIPTMEHDKKLNRATGRRRRRRKRDIPRIRVTKMRAPYEIDQYLDKLLDFDNHLDSQSSSGFVVRKPRTLGSSAPFKPMELDLGETRVDVNKKSVSSAAKEQKNIQRRFSDDYGTNDLQFNLQEVTKPDFKQIFAISNGSHPMPSYLTSNDSALQELLNQRQLLDQLKQNQLPPPYQIDSDTKTAGSLYHVDHGLMLVPSANEKHSHKSKESSKSKKKKKHKKTKDKKKTTVAVKKGGHKKKKEKKEEKKYLKEKKFKGAKKGKKVSKGKGGAGGKKGKKLYKDKGYKKKGFKKVYHKEEWGNKKSFFDEFRDKDFKKKWKKFDDKYNYAQMKKYQAKDEKGAKKVKHHDEVHKKYDKGKWKKSYKKHMKEHKESMKKDKKKKSKGHD